MNNTAQLHDILCQSLSHEEQARKHAEGQIHSFMGSPGAVIGLFQLLSSESTSAVGRQVASVFFRKLVLTKWPTSDEQTIITAQEQEQ
ncbi:hypothetical protein KIPB_010014, partial [Kipferlia bialata]|eukprot:g10014.t1